MWYFNSPEVVFGEEALSHLEQIDGRRAFIVTDANMVRLGFVEQVQQRLAVAGIDSELFAQVEPEPALQTVQRCADQMLAYQPDWIVGLGGGSSIDAAKAAWLLYERPDVDPAGINPFDHFGVRAKARLIAISTTSGTGADATWAVVLTDNEEQRKLALGSRELLPDVAIVDPSFVMELPPQITADTGMDVLTHAIEGYTSSYHNDFSDGPCLKAAQLVFAYLPRAYAAAADPDASDAEAREHMHNAATLAGLGFGNSMAALAHAMGHALGGLFHTPHGRAVGLFLPYAIQFAAKGGGGRYAEIAHFLHLPAQDEAQGAASLVEAIRKLQREIHQPVSLRELGIEAPFFEAALPQLIDNAESDSQLIMNPRIPDSDELERLFRCAYAGQAVDF